MQKRGQVGIFAVIGIVLVILVALFFFARSEFGFFIEPTTFLNDKSKPIEDNLKDCVNGIVSQSLDKFAKQGGDFFPNNFRLYQGFDVKYFCSNIEGVPECTNRIPTLSEMIDNLNRRMGEDVNNCVDEGLVSGGLGYDVDAGVLTTEVSLSGNNILVKADYDVKITKGETKTSVRPVTVSFDAPIEEVYSVAVDIVNAEARVGNFEQLLYMLNERGQFVINVDKPYPDKIYKINKKDNNFELWFAIEGERGV